MTFIRSTLIVAAVATTMATSSAQTVDIALNGGFETGDFTSWEVLPSAPGQTTIVTPGSSGMFAACIDNQQQTSGSVLKNSFLGAGVVAPNSTATITFDARGSAGIGGVAFAEFFSEGAAGVSSAALLGGAPLGIDSDPNVWTTLSFTVTTGPDVTNGVTVQFAAITGAVQGSTMFLCVDNLSVLVDGPAGFPEFCFGDGGDGMGCTDCPCNNNAAAGSGGGCLNSNGTSASLNGSGTASVASDSLRFEVTAATLNTFGILQSADNQLPNMGPCPAGSGILSPVLDGLRCVGGAALRHGTRATDMNGDIGVTNNGWGPPNGPTGGLIAANGFVSGQTRNFQVFYREEITLGCMTGQNTTQGVEVTFAP